MTKSDHLLDRLRVATLATFVSGFINAYTYITQGGSFAGVQSGNLLLLGIKLAQGSFDQLTTYLIPLSFFCLGQGVSYGLRQYARRSGHEWHIFVSGVLIILMLIIAGLSPLLPSYFTLAGLALFASIKVDTFKRVRDMTYASVMMTGNIRNMAHHLVKGLYEKDKILRIHAFLTFLVVLACLLGAVVGTILAGYFHEYSLYFLLIPLSLLYWILKIDS